MRLELLILFAPGGEGRGRGSDPPSTQEAPWGRCRGHGAHLAELLAAGARTSAARGSARPAWVRAAPTAASRVHRLPAPECRNPTSTPRGRRRTAALRAGQTEVRGLKSRGLGAQASQGSHSADTGITANAGDHPSSPETLQPVKSGDQITDPSIFKIKVRLSGRGRGEAGLQSLLTALS